MRYLTATAVCLACCSRLATPPPAIEEGTEAPPLIEVKLIELETRDATEAEMKRFREFWGDKPRGDKR